MTVELGPLHPRHGPHRPTSGSPARAPGSVRRTATIDMLRPEGITGPLVLRGRARDVITRAHGVTEVRDEAGIEAVVDFLAGRQLLALTTDPDRPELEGLVGRKVAAGFRAAALELAPRLPEENNLLNLLIDDLPGAALVSGHAFAVSASREQRQHRALNLRSNLVRDQCAGFVDGGTIMNDVDRFGIPPQVTGPAAPSLVNEDDPEGWHLLEPLPPHGMRRARRIDVRPGTPTVVDVLFRDSHMREDGLETVVHEYTVLAEIDPKHRKVLSCTATAQVLPWLECPAAAASAGRLAGVTLSGLRGYVRATFLGTSTCTHLNDTLRGLEDVTTLLSFADVPEPATSA